MGVDEGAPEVAHPGSVPDHSAVSPSRPRGQGAGGTAGRSGSHGGTQDQAIGDQESDLEPAAEGEGIRGGGDQKGAGGGERAPRCRLPAVPAAAAPPAAASIVCGPALPRVAAPPALRLAMPCALWILGICAWLADLARKTRNNSHSFKYHSLCKRDDLHLPMSTRCQALDCSGDSVTAPGMQRKSRTSGDDRSLAWLPSERLHPTADSDRGRDPQLNSGWSLGTLMEEQEGLQAPDGLGSPQEDQQLTNLDSWGSQRLNHQSQSTHRLDLGLPTHM
ncbi:uncharacterized protein LOC134481533 [Rattus norvegicus]|uniref:uncharacterized protein LOC134481533 n=1 Tax=Rattus norvegicus TaxID=10116 RepID=UPI002FD7E932